MICTKTIFTKHEAEAALKRVATGKQNRREQRIYYCFDCKGWHLTSQESRSENQVVSFKMKFLERWKKLLK